MAGHSPSSSPLFKRPLTFSRKRKSLSCDRKQLRAVQQQQVHLQQGNSPKGPLHGEREREIIARLHRSQREGIQFRFFNFRLQAEQMLYIFNSASLYPFRVCKYEPFRVGEGKLSANTLFCMQKVLSSNSYLPVSQERGWEHQELSENQDKNQQKNQQEANCRRTCLLISSFHTYVPLGDT